MTYSFATDRSTTNSEERPYAVAIFKLNDQHDVIVRRSNDGLIATCDTCSLSATAVKAVIFAFENRIYRMMIDGAHFKRN